MRGAHRTRRCACGTIRIVDDNGDSVEFEQAVNEAYLFAGSDLNEAKHNATAGPFGRDAVTFRFVQTRVFLV